VPYDAHMDNDDETTAYEAPEVRLIGSIADVTQAGHPNGVFDANYSQGAVIPPGGPGTLS
jgi:hypothetical protein